jgi:predicted kinase
MEKPINFVLVGLPYAGKSTLSNELKNRFGFEHINIDQLKFDRGFTSVGDDDVPDEVWDEIFDEADKLLVKHLQSGKNVANEYAWITRQWRDRTRKVALEAGFSTKLIYIKLPTEIIRQRWRLNKENPTRFHWPEAEFEGLLRDFEIPGEDEDLIVYDQTIPVEEWIEKNFR